MAEKETTIIKKSDMKKILQDNQEIGRLSKGIDQVMATVVEQFTKDLIEASLNDDKTSIDMEKLISVISENKKYDFLETMIPKFKELSAPKRKE